ncbi:MAG: hypothetical protein IJ770_02100 [Alphaproteobacteria bacterium]|nr:hypothetical protein [Alphaproteobacteria bacterium]
MENKKTITVNFCDWWSDFNPKNNWLIKLLQKKYNVEMSEKPDFVFYSVNGSKHTDFDNCVKIFLTGENNLPNFNECDYGTGFDYLDFGDRYFRRMYIIPNREICNRGGVIENFFNRRFCNFIYSNGKLGKGAILRQEFCKKLMEYKHVDCPGKILHNIDAEDELAPRNGDWWNSKQEFLKKYKFTIAFENSRSNGYTTEKLMQPLQSFSIPIYWGNPLVTRDFNPKAFINCNDYDNDFDAVIERIKELDNDPDKYLAMLRENPMQPDFDFEQGKKFEQWLMNIIEKGNKPFEKGPVNFQVQELKNKQAALQRENIALKQQISITPQVSLVKPFKKVSGNWLYKRVETERYIKTYICGIRTRKRPANLCKYIDTGLQELERRLKDFILHNK